MHKTLVIQDNDKPLAVLLRFECFMPMQQTIRGVEQPIYFLWLLVRCNSRFGWHLKQANTRIKSSGNFGIGFGATRQTRLKLLSTSHAGAAEVRSGFHDAGHALPRPSFTASSGGARTVDFKLGYYPESFGVADLVLHTLC